MKKTFYITLSLFLGVLLSFFVHAALEIAYLDWAKENGMAIFWQNGCALPLWLDILLFVLGAALGLFLGTYWWKKIYEKGTEKSRVLKLLILILAITAVFSLAWSIDRFYVSGKSEIKPISTLTPEETPTPTVAPTPTSRITSTPTTTTPTPEIPTPTPSLSSSIEIRGDESCQSDTLAALNLLSSTAPMHYAATTEYIGIVECALQGSGIFVWENPPRYKVGDSTRKDSGTMWYASTFPHEACHVKEYREGREYSGEQAETECLNAQYSALEQMGADQYTLDYVQNLASTRYWEVPYEDRWW